VVVCQVEGVGDGRKVRCGGEGGGGAGGVHEISFIIPSRGGGGWRDGVVGI